jgi:pyrroline-5-carboxylate reductase
MSKIACIGGGNMGLALMKGASSVTGAENIFFTDADAEKAKAAADLLGANVLTSNSEAVKTGDYVFLAVKPQVMPTVLNEIAPVLGERLAGGNPPVLVSMAAGWTVKKIQEAVMAIKSPTVSMPVVRIMPNTPALIGKGMIALAASSEVHEMKISELEKILAGAGTVDRLDERYMDAVTGLSGSGPAFVYLFIEALSDGGVLAGLPRDRALRYAARTVLGAAAMVEETGKHPGELKDMVTSPGGTTIAGVATLEAGAFRSAAIHAVEAAWRRAVELGRE